MLFGWPWPPRRSTPSAPPRPRCRRRRPESRRPSGHRHSGSGSRCRLLLDPEGDGSFEQITLHPQPCVLALQLPQPRLLITRQPVLLATVDAVLADPVPQGRVVDAKLTGDLGDRPAAATDQLHRVAFELGSELAPVPWLSVFHADILRSREVSCLRGEVHEAAAGAGAQAPWLAALLEPLFQLSRLGPVPDADQLDLAAGVQGGGEEPGALAAVTVGLGGVPSGQVILPARGEVGGEAAVVLGVFVRRADVREVGTAAPAGRNRPARPARAWRLASGSSGRDGCADGGGSRPSCRRTRPDGLASAQPPRP